MTLYADVIIIENLCINLCILIVTSKILKKEIHLYRLIISSAIGGIYAIITYMNIINNLFVKIIVSILMIRIAFKKQNIKDYIYELLIFYLVTFVFGGVVFFILFNSKESKIIIKNGVFIGINSIKVIVLGIFIGVILLTNMLKKIRKMLNTKKYYGRARIKILNKEINVNIMLDTGNLLQDPISKIPVMIIEKDKLKGIIPDNILKMVKENGGDFNFENISNEYISRIKLIPFSSVGKDKGVLIGIKADQLIIEINYKKYITKDIILGIYNNKFHGKEVYSALLGIEVLERSKIVNEYIANVKGKHKYNLC